MDQWLNLSRQPLQQLQQLNIKIQDAKAVIVVGILLMLLMMMMDGGYLLLARLDQSAFLVFVIPVKC